MPCGKRSRVLELPKCSYDISMTSMYSQSFARRRNDFQGNSGMLEIAGSPISYAVCLGSPGGSLIDDAGRSAGWFETLCFVSPVLPFVGVHRPTLFITIVLLVLAGGSFSFAQDAPQRPTIAPVPQKAASDPEVPDPFLSETRAAGPYVLVDVVPTDAKGQPVVGLKGEDFQVLEKVGWVTQLPEKIAWFRVVDQIRALTPAGSRARLSVPSESRGAGETAAPLTVLLLDGLNSDFSVPGIRQQLAAMADFDCEIVPIDPLCDGVPVAVLRLGPKLEMLQDFSADRGVWQSTLKKAFPEPTLNVGELADSNRTPLGAPVIEGAGDSSSPSPIRNWDRLPSGGSDLTRRVQLTMDTIRAIARRLAGYPGRKRLIWVSSSFPFSIAPDPGINEHDDAGSYRNQAATVMNALWNARVSVYPVQPGPAATTVEDTVGRADATSPMEEFAGLTGGRACFDNDDLRDCFNRALRGGLLHYEIGYYPADGSWQGAFIASK